MDFKFYLSLLLSRLHYVLLLLVLGTSVGVFMATTLPPIYRAAGTLVVEPEQIPDELAASTVQVQASEQLQIIQRRILTREVLLEMANRLDIYAPVEGQPAPRMEAGAIVEDLRQRITIETTGGSTGRGPVQATIVTVAFEAPTAQLAAAVANEVVTLILQENVEMRTRVTGQTLEFFTQEVERLDQALAAKGAEIAAFREANESSLPDSLDFRRSQLAGEQERLLQLERDEATLRDRRDRLVELYETTGGVGAAPAPAANEAQTPEARELQELRNQLSSALAVLAPTNPRVVLLQNQIAAREAVVATQTTGQVVSPDASPVSVYEMQLADLDGQIAYITSEKERLTARMDTLQRSIDATPGNSVALDQLERDYSNLRVQYDRVVANRATAETGDTIEAMGRAQRITVLEQAIPPRAPQSPNRPVVAAAGIIAGLAAGLGLVVLLEVLNRAVRRPVEITNQLGIMPFAALPLIRSRFDVRRRRWRIASAFAVALVGVPVALWIVHSQVMPLDVLVDRVVQRLTLLTMLPDALPGAGLVRLA